MMAAIAAASAGKEVILLEKNEKPGRKLAITGKGRCNVTNARDISEFFDNIPTNSSFLYSALYGFTNADVMRFFEDNGVPLKVERGERVFPVSDKAFDIVDALKNKLIGLGAKIVRDEAMDIKTENGSVTAVVGRRREYKCDGTVIATGGMSYAQTGSTGDGYRFAKEQGHTVTALYPSLIPIVTKEDTSALQGLSLRNSALTVTDAKGKTVYRDFGEMLFTHYGLSGPMILSASGHLGADPEGNVFSIDLKPALSEEKLDERVLRDFSAAKNKDLINSLSELLPAKMIPYIVERSQIPAHEKVNSVTREQRGRLVTLLKDLKFTAAAYRPINEAIITSGGVSVKEINPSTMESKLVKGLFFAGEVIDCDAYTGGFNLQIAFSTGHLAGENV
ncbi:MAG: NAD(P)/FAD-dependent oxidoreductase [Oscillospiraceae bacterium]|nr:NAD(P)/FAD-dependent oxidoreductase [Oscillospiraceae bacterium]